MKQLTAMLALFISLLFSSHAWGQKTPDLSPENLRVIFTQAFESPGVKAHLPKGYRIKQGRKRDWFFGRSRGPITSHLLKVKNNYVFYLLEPETDDTKKFCEENVRQIFDLLMFRPVFVLQALRLPPDLENNPKIGNTETSWEELSYTRACKKSSLTGDAGFHWTFIPR